MALVLKPEHRNALYDQLLDRLSGIGDIEIAINSGHLSEAEQIGREYSDDLRLLLDDLGLGERAADQTELSTPRDVLARVLPRLRDQAEAFSQSREGQWREEESLRERDRLVSEACTKLLRELGAEEIR